MTRRGALTPLTPIWNPLKRRGGIEVGSTPGTTPPLLMTMTDAIGITDTTLPLPVVDIGSMNNPYDIVIDGDYGYLIDFGFGIHTLDLSNPNLIDDWSYVGSVDSPWIARLPGYVYIAQGNLLRVYSLADPTEPALVGSTGTAVGANGITASGSYVYTSGAAADRVYVTDVSTPTAPTTTGSVTNAVLDEPAGLAYSSSHVFVACSASDRLVSINVSNPVTPTVAGSVTNAVLDGATDVKISGTVAYVTAPTAGRLVAVDISTPASPTIIASLGGAVMAGATTIEVLGNYAYVIAVDEFDYDRLVVVDISSPATMTVAAVVGTVIEAGHSIALQPSRDRLYVTDRATAKLISFDISAF